MTAVEVPTAPVPRRQVAAWCAWDWGSAAFNAVMTTFIFTVYLTGAVGEDLPGGGQVGAGPVGQRAEAGGGDALDDGVLDDAADDRQSHA